MSRHFPDLFNAWGQELPVWRTTSAVVVGHARPDGDCIGSQVALARVLRAIGCPEVTCVNADPVPRRLAFLTGEETFVPPATPAPETQVFFVDCADRLRPGVQAGQYYPKPTVNVDHHVSNRGFARHNFVDTAAAATCEILAGLFLDHDWPIDPITAQALYVGIATDTGQFRFGSTTQRVFDLAAALVARGADPARAGHELYERENPGRMQLLQRFIASFEQVLDGRACIGLLPAGIFEETATTPEDTEGLVDYARAIDGVEVGVLIEERADGIKASLRGHDPRLRLDQVAAHFGGGGHACAAGLNVKGMSLAEFRLRLISSLQEAWAALESERS